MILEILDSLQSQNSQTNQQKVGAVKPKRRGKSINTTYQHLMQIIYKEFGNIHFSSEHGKELKNYNYC